MAICPRQEIRRLITSISTASQCTTELLDPSPPRTRCSPAARAAPPCHGMPCAALIRPRETHPRNPHLRRTPERETAPMRRVGVKPSISLLVDDSRRAQTGSQWSARSTRRRARTNDLDAGEYRRMLQAGAELSVGVGLASTHSARWRTMSNAETGLSHSGQRPCFRLKRIHGLARSD
jgi:hypothetical protein